MQERISPRRSIDLAPHLLSYD
jgi:hypothetical protein